MEPRGSQEAQEAENDEFLMKFLMKMIIFGAPSLPGRRPRKPTLPGGPGKEREKEGEADKREGTTAGEEDNKENKNTIYL